MPIGLKQIGMYWMTYQYFNASVSTLAAKREPEERKIFFLSKFSFQTLYLNTVINMYQKGSPIKFKEISQLGHVEFPCNK